MKLPLGEKPKPKNQELERDVIRRGAGIVCTVDHTHKVWTRTIQNARGLSVAMEVGCVECKTTFMKKGTDPYNWVDG